MGAGVEQTANCGKRYLQKLKGIYLIGVFLGFHFWLGTKGSGRNYLVVINDHMNG